MIDLYRMFDADDRLLYVGISINAALRSRQHRQHQPWWREVAHIDIDHLDMPRRQAEAVERAAIVAEQPRYNLAHNDPTHPLADDERDPSRTYMAGYTAGFDDARPHRTTS